MADELNKNDEQLEVQPEVEFESQPEQDSPQPEQEAQPVEEESKEKLIPSEEKKEEPVAEEPATEEVPIEEEKKEEIKEESSAEEEKKEEPVVEKEEQNVPEEPEVVKEEVDIEAIKAELEELKAEKQEKLDVDTLNKEHTRVAREYDQLCGFVSGELEKKLRSLDIPLDKSIEDLEKEDRAKAEIAKDLISKADKIIADAKQAAFNYLNEKTQDVIFKKADRLLQKFDLTEEEADVVATTFLDIIGQSGVRDLGEDLKAKVELAVAKAKMVCKRVEQVAETVADKAAEVHDKIEKVEEIIKPVEEKPKEEAKEEVKEELPKPEPEAPKPDTSEFEEGVGNKPQPSSGLSIDNVVEKMLELPFKEQTKFYKEHFALIEEAMKRRAR